MPLPKPHTNESESDYMSRCISFVSNEGYQQSQAVAMCESEWDNKNKGMKIYCKELDKEFNSQDELIKAIWSNKTKIIDLKKAAIYKSVNKGHLSCNIAKTGTTKSLEIKEGFVYPVINTTMFFDSHNDVHMNGIWSKTLKENKNFYYVNDHSLNTKDVITWPQDVKAFTTLIDWQSLGFKYEGQTQALIFEIEKEKIVNAEAKEIIEKKRPVQNSVRMQYVKIELAVNSNDKEYKEAKKIWDKHINQIANKEQAKENGYMWLVHEAKIEKEGSMVLFGSNPSTPILTEQKHSDNEPQTSDNEPLKSTHKTINNLLINSFKI